MFAKALFNIKAIFNALKKGERLLYVETWKNTQLAVDSITSILVLVAVFMPNLGLENEQIQSLALGIALIGGALSSYWTIATTDKIGLPNNTNSDINELPPTDTGSTNQVQPENSLNGGQDLLSGK